ncbi:hypothetical protein [Bosea sp. (in: a-proteobacteria)]
MAKLIGDESRQAGQTVGSFGPNRPFAATLAEKAAFPGHRAAPRAPAQPDPDFSMTWIEIDAASQAAGAGNRLITIYIICN